MNTTPMTITGALWIAEITAEQVQSKAAEVAKFFLAIAEGRTLQWFSGMNGWIDQPLNSSGPCLLSDLDFWRVKPEPTTSISPPISETKWKRFWFEGNRYFGWINGPEDWQRLRDAYEDKTDDQLLAAKKCDEASVPNYGFRREHTGSETLADFFTKHGMTTTPKK